MGKLSSDQYSAISSGARVRQKWSISIPMSDPPVSAYESLTIHDDADQDTQCVTNAGSRTVTGYNISLREPGEIEVGSYSIEVDNTLGQFCPKSSNNYFQAPTGKYQADPARCYLEHVLYLYVDGAWESILTYKGNIVSIEYESLADVGGTFSGHATITAISASVNECLLRKWAKDDGTTLDTGISILGPEYGT